jgi:hypothetical protein
VRAKSPHVVVTITDHLGTTDTSRLSGCARQEALQILTNKFNITQTRRQWSVEIGQCPRYTTEYVSASSKSLMVWVYVAIICLGALLIAGAIVFSVHVNEKDVKLRIAMATHSESTRAHRWIIGYGTGTAVVVVPSSVFFF